MEEKNIINKIDFKEGTIEYFIKESIRDKAILEVLETNDTFDMLQEEDVKKLRERIFNRNIELDSAWLFEEDEDYGMDIIYKGNNVIHIRYIKC